MKLSGHEVNFGYKEIVLLMQSAKYSEKYTGYITVPIIIPDYEEDIYTNLQGVVRADLFAA